MRERKESLAKTITLEMGKLIAQAEGEITLSADILDYYATNGEKFLADQTLSPDHGSALIRHSPIGVLLGVENTAVWALEPMLIPSKMINRSLRDLYIFIILNLL